MTDEPGTRSVKPGRHPTGIPAVLATLLTPFASPVLPAAAPAISSESCQAKGAKLSSRSFQEQRSPGPNMDCVEARSSCVQKLLAGSVLPADVPLSPRANHTNAIFAGPKRSGT